MTLRELIAGSSDLAGPDLDAACAVIRAAVDAERAPADDAVRADAERWRKLMALQRIRLLGSARLGDIDGHIGLELWGLYPGLPPHEVARHEAARATLTAFVDGLRPPAATTYPPAADREVEP